MLLILKLVIVINMQQLIQIKKKNESMMKCLIV